MDIEEEKEKETIVIEPIEDPVPRTEPAEAPKPIEVPAPVEAPELEPVPAGRAA